MLYSDGFYVIETAYSNTIDLITVTEKIEGIARYVKQSGSSQFAIIKYLIEPFESDYPIVFESKAKMEPALKKWGDFNDDFHRYLEAIKNGIKSSADFYYTEDKKKIGKIKITILDLLIHPSDSKEMAYKIAGAMIIKDNFKNKLADC